jgi:hypothetical protein
MPSWPASGSTARSFGATPGEAFWVKCDGENNTSETIDAGQLIVEIGHRAGQAAEFVVFRIAQFSGGASADRVIPERPEPRRNLIHGRWPAIPAQRRAGQLHLCH